MHRSFHYICYGNAMIKFKRNTKPLVGAQLALFSILGFWSFYAAIVTLRAAVMNFQSPGELIALRMVVIAVGIAVTWGLYLFLRLFDRKTLRHRITAAFIGAIPCAIFIAFANYYIFSAYDPVSLFADNNNNIENQLREINKVLGISIYQQMAEFAVSRYFFIISWALLFIAIGYAREVREIERTASRFAQAAQNAELRSLRYQVNPHFLFNTLNSLSTLIIKNHNERAETMIQNLSTFYRTSLSNDPLEDVTLAEEVHLQKLYLDIEAVRYPKRLIVKVDIDNSLMNVRVPGLILQPLVENAIKYGVSRSTKPVTVEIKASVNESQLQICIADDGEYFPDMQDGGSGIGLANVRDRLETRFGDAATLKCIDLPEGGYKATIIMPLHHHNIYTEELTIDG